jgi:hypothetical protein
MNRIFNFSNVYLDSNSAYKFENLIETEYLENTLKFCQERMGYNFDEFDFYIFSNHNNSVPASASIQNKKRKVLIYISDEAAHSPAFLSENYFAIFKSYIGSKYSKHNSNIFPFPLGYVNCFKANSEIRLVDRQYDVFFSGNLNNSRWRLYKECSYLSLVPDFLFYKLMLRPTWRQRLFKLVGTDFTSTSRRWFVKFNNGFKTGLDIETYSSMLSRSKIVFSPKGFESTETFRLTEALSCGCIVISENLPNVPFYKGAPIIQVKNWKEGLAATRALLKQPERLAQLQQNSIKWWNDNLSDEGVSRYIVESIKQLSEKNRSI